LTMTDVSRPPEYARTIFMGGGVWRKFSPPRKIKNAPDLVRQGGVKVGRAPSDLALSSFS